jgi:hypothetical protein
MNHPWQQPITPFEVSIAGVDEWKRVLFIRPSGTRGWETITTSGNVWTSENAWIRPVSDDKERNNADICTARP